jgi:hypothetical protein
VFEPFLKRQITASYETVLTHSFRRPGDHLTPIHPLHAIPYVLISKALIKSGSTNKGIHLKVLSGIGTDQARELTVDDFSRRFSGRAVDLTVQAKLVDSSDSLELVGGLAFEECEATTETCFIMCSNLIGAKNLTFAIINADSAIGASAEFGDIQRETSRISISAPKATSTTPQTVLIFGKRYQDDAIVPLASYTPTTGAGGGTYQTVDILPGEFQKVHYQVPTSVAGDDLGKLYIWEELRAEG